MTPPARVRVRVPATSANLGPGFDAFGLALARYNTFEASLADEWRLDVSGEGAGVLPSGSENPVAAAAARLFAEAGFEGAAHIACDNTIPLGGGLGSSAAAIVGGLLIADALAGTGMSRDALFALAAGIEGHPDNVAAAVWGGFTVCWDDDGSRAVRLEPRCGLAAVIVQADEPLATAVSRSLLPETVPHADAAFNAGRAGLLAAGIALGDADMLAAGLADRIHEPYRALAVPDIDAVRDALVGAGAAGAVLSGAGPTVVGLVCGGDDGAARTAARDVAAAAAPAIAMLPHRRTPLVLAVDRSGGSVDRLA